MPVSGPLKWHGGKAYLASKIVALMPKHLHYVEPYFGGGAVLLAKNPEGISEVVNDKHLDLTIFWRVLSSDSHFDEFLRIVQATPFSEAEWKVAENPEPEERPGMLPMLSAPRNAAAFFIRCRQSLAGRMQQFTGVTKTRTRRGMNNEVSAWLTAIEGLPVVHARLKRVLILNRDALDVIRGQDGPETLFYLDPPYLHETRKTTKEYGAYEMTEEQHVDLCTTIRKCVGKVMISGYPSELYRFQLEAQGWHRTDFKVPNHAAGGATKRVMTEAVWTNFVPPKLT